MTEDRNTPSDILFDMEDDIGDLRRLGSTLLLISTTEGLEDVVQDALHHVACGISDCHRELHVKFKGLFDQIVRTDTDSPEPGKPAAPVTDIGDEPPTEPTIHDLCHKWDIVAAKLKLEVLERGHEQETIDHLCEPAEARWREIETAILETEPATIRDVDLAVMLRLARKILDNDEYATSKDAAEAMLDLIDLTFILRTRPKDWHRDGAEAERQAVQS